MWSNIDDHDGVWNSIYKPPPLDEVWLSETERQECRDTIEQQHWWHSTLEHQHATDAKKDLNHSHNNSLHTFPAAVTSNDSAMYSDPLGCSDPGSEGDDNTCHHDHQNLDNNCEQSQMNEVSPVLNISSEGDSLPEGVRMITIVKVVILKKHTPSLTLLHCRGQKILFIVRNDSRKKKKEY